MSKYGDVEWRLREAKVQKDRRGITTRYLPGGVVYLGRVWCTIRDGECPRPGPGLETYWRCPCRGERCEFGGGGRWRMVEHVAPFTVVEKTATARGRESTPATEDDNPLSKVLKF